MVKNGLQVTKANWGSCKTTMMNLFDGNILVVKYFCEKKKNK